MKSFSDKTIGNSICADAMVLMTAHREFMEQIPGKNIDFKEELREKIRWSSNGSK